MEQSFIVKPHRISIQPPTILSGERFSEQRTELNFSKW